MTTFRLIAIAAMIVAFTSSAFAQTSKGFFVGNLSDQNGAVVSGAAVKITNASTGVTRVTTSTDDGSFRFDAIDPGTYRIEITQSGFKTIARDGLVHRRGPDHNGKFPARSGHANGNGRR